MRKEKRKPSLIFINLRMGALLGLASCVSAPHFNPSPPLESARSFQEGLWICHQYRIPRDASRHIVYRPYRDCVNSVSRSQHVPPDSAFPVLVLEIRAIDDFLEEMKWSEGFARDLETATLALFRALWNEGGDPGFYTPEEKNQVLTLFPLTASALGAETWRTQEGLWLDPELERLKAIAHSLLRAKGVPVTPKSPEAWSKICSNLETLTKELDYFQNLWSDMAQLAKLPNGHAARARREQGYRNQLKRAGRKWEALADEVLKKGLENQISREACGGGLVNHA